MEVLQTSALPLGHVAINTYGRHKACRFLKRATRFELVAFSLARRRSTAELCPHNIHKSESRCQDPDSNWGHLHFQCSALPTELSRQISYLFNQREGNSTQRRFNCQVFVRKFWFAGKIFCGSGCVPVDAPVFKTGGRLRGASGGGFDSHPLPPEAADSV
jgi:hypothetical protein